MRIFRQGIYRNCTQKQYKDKFKAQGYVIVKEKKDIEQYHKGGGWYEYEGETYRKSDLLEVIK